MKKLVAVAVCLLMVGCKSEKVPTAEDLFNDEAKVAQLGHSDLGWVPLTVSVDRGAETTSILFGNAEAVKDVRSGEPYKDGADLKLVTWKQREDPHWFGGRIPGAVASVEVVAFESGGPSYGRFAGSPLLKITENDAARQAAIVGMKVAQLP